MASETVPYQDIVLQEIAGLHPAEVKKVLAFIDSLRRGPTEEDLLTLLGRVDGEPEEIERLVTQLAKSRRITMGLRLTLQEIAEFQMPRKRQRRLSGLLLKNQEGTLKPQEQTELDELLAEVRVWTLKKAQARTALKRLFEIEQEGQGTEGRST